MGDLLRCKSAWYNNTCIADSGLVSADYACTSSFRHAPRTISVLHIDTDLWNVLHPSILETHVDMFTAVIYFHKTAAHVVGRHIHILRECNQSPNIQYELNGALKCLMAELCKHMLFLYGKRALEK